MTLCPKCNNPLEQYDMLGLDCPVCLNFYDHYALWQMEQEQIRINEREAFEEWQLEQLVLELAA